MAIELPPDYYLHNFRYMLDFVYRHYVDLLNNTENTFYKEFCSSPINAQRLLVRLLMRKGPVYRLQKLQYDEIDDLPAAALILENQALLAINPELPLQVIATLYTKREIINRCMLIQCHHLSRSAVLETIQQAETAIGQQQLQADDTLLQLNCKTEFQSFRLLFFGNLHQDLSEFVLRDLGLQLYEDYKICTGQRFFSSRHSLDRHLAFYALQEQTDNLDVEDSEAINVLHRQLPLPEPAMPVLNRRLHRLRNRLARHLERLGLSEQALVIYQLSERPPSRERQARILARQQKYAACMALCAELLENPRNEEERWFGINFGGKIAGKLNQPWTRHEKPSPPVQELQLSEHPADVEMAACQHLQTQGDCYYVENHLFNGVLGLFIWDIVFTPLEGVFFNPFQHAPGDYYEPEFIERRQELISRRFDELQTNELFRQRVLNTWKNKHKRMNPLVHWPALDQDLLNLALQRIPRQQYSLIFERLLQDRRHNRSGLPDLIFFPPEAGYKLIEVKGPGDRLQKNQLRWMSFFAKHDIAHCVLNVTWMQ